MPLTQPIELNERLLRAYFAADYTGATKTSDVSSLQVKIWSKEVEDYCKPILRMDRFAVKKTVPPGTKTVRIHRRSKISPANNGDLTEGTSLIGNETKLDFDYIEVTPTMKGAAVAITEEAEATTLLELRNEAKIALGNWLAEKIEDDYFTAIKNNMTSARIITPGGNDVSALTSSDVLTPDLVSQAKHTLLANDVPSFAAEGNALREAPPDQGFYVMIVRPEQLYDFVQQTDYKTAAAQAAVVQANQILGPAWKGFATYAYWDGVLILPSTKTDFTQESGYTAKVAKAFIFGPRAFARAIQRLPFGGGEVTWRERVDDYNLLRGFAVITKYTVTVLNPRRIFGVYTGATELSLVSESGS